MVRIRQGLNPSPAKTFTNKIEAIAWRDEMLSGAGRYVRPEHRGNIPTFAEAAIHYVQQAAMGKVRSRKTAHPPAAGTLASYESVLRRWVLPATLPGYRVPLGELPVDTVDENVLELMMTVVQAEASDATARVAHAAVRSVLTFGKTKTWVSHIPRPIVLPPPPKPRSAFYGSRQMVEILTAADTDDLAHDASFAYPLIAFLYEGGGRITETLATDFTRDPRAPGLDLWSARAEWRIPREHTKTRNGEREVPLDEDLKQVLLAHWRALGEPAMGSPVFPSRQAARATRSGAVREAFRRIEIATGIARICAHNFRRTNTTDLLEANVPLNEAAKRLGHANGAFLLRFYAQWSPEGQLAASERLSDYRRRQGVELRAAPGAGPDGGETPPAQVNGRPTATHESPRRPPQDAEVS